MIVSNYFDVNGRIGKNISGISDFTDPESLIAHMDYLGIARALVWDYEARDVNPTRGNKSLIEKIGQKEEFKKRLIPAFVVTPAIVFDNDGLAYLKKSLESGMVKALRIFPFSSRFNIGALNMLFEEIRSFAPVVVWNFMDTNGRTDIVEFGEMADKFKHFNFVITELMWGSFTNALDLLWRHENILMDVSWMHTNGAIEILIERFGAERVVFGTGFKTHYGAAIAALQHSTVDESVKEKIAYGNIERILGLATEKTEQEESPLLKDKPLWKAFKAGLALSSVEVVDAHGHSGPYPYGWIMRTSDLNKIFDSILKKMDALGIDRMILSHMPAFYGDCLDGNRELQEILSGKYKNRIFGYLAFNPHYKDALTPELDKFFASGVFKGFKLHADCWKVPLTDSAYDGAWQYADKHSLPVLLHTWGTVYNSPAMLTDIVKKYPQATFILGHAGGGEAGRKEAVYLARNNENVFLEYCGSFVTSTDWMATFKDVGFEKVVFGSDADAHDQAWELGRLLSLPTPDQNLLPVLAGNINKILAKSKI